jgi:hypothetical protein
MFQMKKLLLIIALVATAVGSAYAQIKLGNNPGVLDPKALLELESTTKGLLMPRMNTTQQNTITAPDGMMIYNTDSSCICVRGGGVWRSLCADGNGRPWGTYGNANTNPTNNFIGTSDNQALVFRTNNAEVMRILTSGNIGIGTTAPGNKLHIVASADPLRIEGLQTSATSDSVVTVDAVTGVLRRTTMAIIGANSIVVGNGLTKVGNLITFGGPLTSPTVINTDATNTLTLTHLQTGTLNLPTDSILTTGLNGVVRRVSVNDLAAASPDFWQDIPGGLKPNGLTDDIDNVYHLGNVGIGAATAPTSKFQVTGSVSMSIVNTSAATFTLDATHHTLIADCTTATIAVTLPDPTGCTGRMYYISKSDETTNPLTFSRPLRLTDGATPVTVSSYNYTKRLIIQSDGTNWRVISE